MTRKEKCKQFSKVDALTQTRHRTVAKTTAWTVFLIFHPVKQTKTNRDRQRKAETSRDRQRQMQVNRDIERQLETGRFRQRQADTDGDMKTEIEADNVRRHTETYKDIIYRDK